MNDQIINCSQLMSKYKNIDFQKADKITTVWKSVVSSIHSNKYESEDSERRIPIGERLAGNTRVIDLKNGVLLVETDHSGWIQYLRMYQKYILKGLQMKVPELKVNNLAFRIAGSKASLSDTYEQQVKSEKLELLKKLDKQDEELNKKFKETKKEVSTLPPELLEKFESIKRSMLTNTEN